MTMTTQQVHDTKEYHTRSRPSDAPVKRRLDTLLPPNKRYIGLRRHAFLLLLGAALLLIIGLTVGLAVGLRPKSQAQPAIPLPEYGGVHFANVTFYRQTAEQDACGKLVQESTPNVSTQNVVAMSTALWDAMAAKNSTLCGRRINIIQRVEYETNGDPNMPIAGTSSSSYSVVDRCNACGPRDLAIPGDRHGLQLVKSGEERAEVSWEWMEALDG